RPAQALVERDGCLPAEPRARLLDVRTQPVDLAAGRPEPRLVREHRQLLAKRYRDVLGDLADGCLAAGAGAEHFTDRFLDLRAARDAGNRVLDVEEVARRLDGAELEVVAREGLRDDRGDDRARGLPRAERVERPRHDDRKLERARVAERELVG